LRIRKRARNDKRASGKDRDEHGYRFNRGGINFKC
jgi:hypothetical protein